ncbi:tetratricopeptide repeat protein [Prosthecomicrobium sp. N25]|uniref:tetratricopeptide repeat protein n=1 Tax=Prosthecomicrobium sp. N25 TaxID=3129254 RepID=UPI003077166A
MRAALVLLAAVAAAGTAVALGGPEPFGRLALAAGWGDGAARLLEDPVWRGTALYRAGRYGEAVEAFRAAGPQAAFARGNALARSGAYKEAVVAYDQALAVRPSDEDARVNRAIVQALVEAEALAPSGGGSAANASASREKKSTGADPNSGQEGEESTGDGMAGDRETGTASTAPGGSKAARKGAAEQATTESGEGQARGSATDSEGAGRSGGAAALAKAFEQAAIRQALVNKPFDNKSIVASRQWLATLPDDPGRFLKLRLQVEREQRAEKGLAVPPGGDPW